MRENMIKSRTEGAYLGSQAVEAIETILKRGNNAIVKRSKNGVTISEEYQKIKYRTTQSDE